MILPWLFTTRFLHTRQCTETMKTEYDYDSFVQGMRALTVLTALQAGRCVRCVRFVVVVVVVVAVVVVIGRRTSLSSVGPGAGRWVLWLWALPLIPNHPVGVGGVLLPHQRKRLALHPAPCRDARRRAVLRRFYHAPECRRVRGRRRGPGGAIGRRRGRVELEAGPRGAGRGATGGRGPAAARRSDCKWRVQLRTRGERAPYLAPSMARWP